MVSIPIGPVPLTMQTAAIMLCALLLPTAYAVMSVILYIILGMIGLPVFSGGNSGIDTLFGPTGGFLIGFPIMAFIVSYLTKDIKYNISGINKTALLWKTFWPCIIATVVLQICGLMWGKYSTDNSWQQIYEIWLHPFYFNMVVKILIAGFGAIYLWSFFEKKE
ncbi:MAG: biotin transporter BioY [Kordiimonadaceae bacterium]|nr:biotin transporter BioY [Kordiimonadaceae bacterium]